MVKLVPLNSFSMPTYEFRCPDGHRFEHFYRTISLAQSELACPVCGKLAERLVSGGAGLVFKGSGFYITDYGKDGKKDQKVAEKGEAAKPESAAKADSGTTDSAPSAAAKESPTKSPPAKGGSE